MAIQITPEMLALLEEKQRHSLREKKAAIGPEDINSDAVRSPMARFGPVVENARKMRRATETMTDEHMVATVMALAHQEAIIKNSVEDGSFLNQFGEAWKHRHNWYSDDSHNVRAPSATPNPMHRGKLRSKTDSRPVSVRVPIRKTLPSW